MQQESLPGQLQELNYTLWAEQQNAAGGLDVAGARRPIELIGHDDRSELEACVRLYERLMIGDKVDLILPPWGTTANSAVATLANRQQYPMLAPTAMSRRLVDMNLPYFFSMLQQADRMMGALVDLLQTQDVKTLAFMYMDDLFGLENFGGLNAALGRTGIRVLLRKSYRTGVHDLTTVLTEMKALKPDAFVGLTYPAETVLVSQEAQKVGFNPRFFYTSVGTGYSKYREFLGSAAEGVMGMGSWNAKSNPEARTYFEAHVRRFGGEPDRWASGHCWAGLQILTEAVSRAGLNRRSVRDTIAAREFRTVIGPVRFKGSENLSTPGTVGQWQFGEFEIVWPAGVATATPRVKPRWT